MMKRALFLLFLLTLAFARHVPGHVDSILVDWRVYALMAAFISVLAASLLLMLSRLLDVKQLETVFKSEMVFAGSTVFMVLLLIFFIEQGEPLLLRLTAEMFRLSYNVGGAAGTFTFPEYYKLSDVAILYMQPMASCAQGFIGLLYGVNLFAEPAASMYQEMFMSEQATGGGSKPLVEVIKSITKSLTFYMMAYFLLVHTLNFIKHYALFFLSVGIVLRAFPPTRGAGAYLMAISLGLYFVFPFAFVFMSTLSATPLQGLVDVQDLTGPPDERFTCNLPSLPVDMPVCGAQERWRAAEQLSWLEAYGEEFDNLILDALTGRLLQPLVINICLIPIVAMTATITFVLSTTNLFGGQIPEIGRGLIKLI